MNIKVKIMVNISLFIALEVILSRFCSIATPVVKIGFGFVPIAICAMMYGPVWAGMAGALSDIIGANLFPIGIYFPGFTVSAALTGIVFGLFLYNRKVTWLQLSAAVAINCICISLLLSTYWLSVLSGTAFIALLPARIMQNIIMIPVQLAVLRIMKKPIDSYIKQFA